MILKYAVMPFDYLEDMGKNYQIGVKYVHPSRILIVGGKTIHSEDMILLIKDWFRPQNMPRPIVLRNNTTKFKMRIGFNKFVQAVSSLKNSVEYEIEPARNLTDLWG